MITKSFSVPFGRAVVGGSALGLSTVLLGFATPALADVPEGWSDPDPMSWLTLALLVGAIPVVCALVIAILVILPAVRRGDPLKPESADQTERQWLGGPDETRQLAAPDGAGSQAGGASGRW